jgi:hypothetical protein
MIDLGDGSNVLIPLDAVKYIRVYVSRIALAQQTPPVRPLQ